MCPHTSSVNRNAADVVYCPLCGTRRCKLAEFIMGPVQPFKRACQNQCLRKAITFDEVMRRDQILRREGGRG